MLDLGLSPRGWGHSDVGKVKIPYYTVRRNNRGFWEPRPAMRALGFGSVSCGRDGPAAWAIAEEWNRRWQQVRRGEEHMPVLPHGEVSAAKIYPRGSLGEAFSLFRRTTEWSKKAPRTREEWDRVWTRIDPILGDLSPPTITFTDVELWRDAVEASVSLREAHRCIKIWRAFWRVATAMGYCRGVDDPSKAIRNRSAAARQAIWREGEVTRLAKAAWRLGYKGLAAFIAVSWDTQLSPVDVRGLTLAHARRDQSGLAFSLDRAKTGRAAFGTLTRRGELVLEAYLRSLGVDLLRDAPMFRHRHGRPYSKDTLGDDFRDVRIAVFGSLERRTLADFRRSGTVEALNGGADVETISAKMANTLSASNALFRTYAPVQIGKVRDADKARQKGRSLAREKNG